MLNIAVVMQIIIDNNSEGPLSRKCTNSNPNRTNTNLRNSVPVPLTIYPLFRHITELLLDYV